MPHAQASGFPSRFPGQDKNRPFTVARGPVPRERSGLKQDFQDFQDFQDKSLLHRRARHGEGQALALR